MNTTIKLRLDREEFTPVKRLADELHVTPETIVYAGLHCLMERTNDPAARREIVDMHLGRQQSLPAWADHPRGVHIYESKHDE